VGVANFLAKRGQVIQGGELYGKAFENWVLHELRCYDSYRERYANFSYWRLSSGIEVDFIINELECAIECKSTSLVQEKHLKGLRELGKEHSGVKRRILLAQEVHPRKTPDGIEILNITLFLQELWAGKLF
jgi:predicted AAA+ superfamily ATPase